MYFQLDSTSSAGSCDAAGVTATLDGAAGTLIAESVFPTCGFEWGAPVSQKAGNLTLVAAVGGGTTTHTVELKPADDDDGTKANSGYPGWQATSNPARQSKFYRYLPCTYHPGF